MQDFGTAILVTMLTWWFSTGAILFLDGLPRWTYRWSMAAAGLLAAASLYAVFRLGDDVTSLGAYAGFVAAILLWGFVEMSFLMGIVTGSWRQECPMDSRGLSRFILAARTVDHHELLLVVILAAILAMSWDKPNQTAFLTFLVLWSMRLSTKLNIFLGVPNITEQFLPPHLAYLKTFFRHRAMNLLFPLSATLGTVATVMLAMAAAQADPGTHAAVSLVLLATLTALGVIEHWFLVIPLDVAQLWSWGLRSHGREHESNSASIALVSRDGLKAPADMLPVGEPAVSASPLKWTPRVPCAGANP